MKLATLFPTAVISVICAAGVAYAEDSVTTAFNYDPNAPIEVTYSEFRETAKQACAIKNFRRVGDPMRKFKYERACQKDLLDQVVEATQSRALIALHRGQESNSDTPQRLAQTY